MLLLLWSLLPLCVVAKETEGRPSRLVYITQGPVRGYKHPVGDVYQFYNIPYATAPKGPDKYKASLPPPVWHTPLEAINRNIACPQAGTRVIEQIMQEDCLVVNIHVPNTDDKNLPVVVYVHGGAYQGGYGDFTKPMNFVKNKNIIFVTFNYRVGIQGYLCLGTHDVPGNAGMKDMVALLRWVKNNIGEFGGNPQDVTIAGCSSGGSAVDLLMLSKTTIGLFNKVISGSGCSMNAFSVQIDPLKTAKDHAKALNFSNVDDIYALEEFYKTISFEYLVMNNTFEGQKDTTVVFAPCVERYTGVEMFLDEAPVHILKNKKYRQLPIMYGLTNMEGLMRLPEFHDWKHDMNENFSDFLPGDLQFQNEEEKKKVAKTVKEFYFGNQTVNENNILSYIDFNTDVNFAYSILWSVNIQLSNGNNQIYLYEFSFVEHTVPLIPYTNVRGAMHCEQQYGMLDGIRDGSTNETTLSATFKTLKVIMRDMMSNFITSGQPVPTNSSLPMWPPVGSKCSPHMSFGQTVELKGPLLEQRVKFWDDIYARYYRVPQPPNPNLTHKSNSK